MSNYQFEKVFFLGEQKNRLTALKNILFLLPENASCVFNRKKNLLITLLIISNPKIYQLQLNWKFYDE